MVGVVIGAMPDSRPDSVLGNQPLVAKASGLTRLDQSRILALV